jgi:dihydrofolate reductase
MRKVVVMMSISLDGYIAGPNGEIGWHRVSEELHRHFNEHLRPMGAFLHGRTMYELMAGFWPTADADPASSPGMVEYAKIWRAKPKIVYSRTLSHVDWNSTLVREVVAAEVNELKAQPGGDLALGGADLAASFARLGLIDEYRVYVHPAVIGGGKSLFAPGTRADLELIETRRFDNGVVLLRYQR